MMSHKLAAILKTLHFSGGWICLVKYVVLYSEIGSQKDLLQADFTQNGFFDRISVLFA